MISQPEPDELTGQESASLESKQPVLEIISISKAFGPVRALRDVNVELYAGEVLGLLGDNGAGKSTLVKCVSGTLHPDSGYIRVDGRRAQIRSPQDARALGIETVYQDLQLVDVLDVPANLFLNREVYRKLPRGLRWLRILNQRQMLSDAAEIVGRLRIQIPSLRLPVEDMSGGQRQSVAVSRAVAWGRHVVLMDEPVAALGVEQTRSVLDLVKRLGHEGIAVIYISHNMQHVMEVCDRAVVLWQGQVVGNVLIPDVEPRDLVDLITGATLGSL